MQSNSEVTTTTVQRKGEALHLENGMPSWGEGLIMRPAIPDVDAEKYQGMLILAGSGHFPLTPMNAIEISNYLMEYAARALNEAKYKDVKTAGPRTCRWFERGNTHNRNGVTNGIGSQVCDAPNGSTVCYVNGDKDRCPLHCAGRDKPEETSNG